jgi:hypothetical protein
MGMTFCSRSRHDSAGVFSPSNRKNCLGCSVLLSGQNRVPLPPAMMTAQFIFSPYACDKKGFEDLRQKKPQKSGFQIMNRFVLSRDRRFCPWQVC